MQAHLNFKDVVTRAQSPVKDVRLQATSQLEKMESEAGYPLMVLTFIESAAKVPADAGVCQMASIVFKNYIKKNWVQDEDTKSPISEADRITVKAGVVNLMCAVPARIQSQLSEVVSIISKQDFPAKWQNLLPDMVGKLGSSNDFHVINGLLLTANAIFKRYRGGFKSNEILYELKYILDIFAAPLLELYRRTWAGVETAAKGGGAGASGAALRAPLEALRLMARVFYSLNYQDLPEYFEDNMAEWMKAFAAALQHSNPVMEAEEQAEEDEAGPITRLQGAVVQVLALYAEKYEEEFQSYLPQFTQTVWTLLMRVSVAPKHDGVAIASMAFLAAVVKKRLHYDLFKEESTLRQVVTNIVAPNLQMRDSDHEMFEDEPLEYIRRDIEGSDSDTRRRAASDLVRGLCRQFQQQVTAICQELIGSLLADYAAAPAAKWRSKDTAIALMLAVTVEGATAAHGARATNPHVDVSSFFSQHIMPELQPVAGAAVQPVVQADAVKFLTTFRNQLPVDACVSLLPLLAALMSAPASTSVVRSYAADGVERFLAMRENDGVTTAVAAAGGATRGGVKIGRGVLKPHLQPLLQGLMFVLEKEQLNVYAMKASMRLIATSGPDLTPLVQPVLQQLTAQLGQVAANQSSAQFTHYLFETLAALIRGVCGGEGAAGGGNAAACAEFERLLFPPFQTVLGMEVAELMPYVFQMMALLLELRPAGVSQAYTSLYLPLLTPRLWESKGNGPGLVRLLQAYLRKAKAGGEAAALVLGGADSAPLVGLLGVWQKLVSSRSTEGSAMVLLEALVSALPAQRLEPFMPQVFSLLLMRLQSCKKASESKFAKLLVHFLSVLLVEQARVGGPAGPATAGAGLPPGTSVVERLEASQAGLTAMVVQQVWLASVGEGWGTKRDRHAQAVGLAQLVQLPALKQMGGGSVWGMVVRSLVLVVGGEESSKLTADDDEGGEEIAYDSVFCQLRNASLPTLGAASSLASPDPLLAADVGEPRQMLADALRSVGAAARPLIPADALQPLTAMMAPFGVNI